MGNLTYRELADLIAKLSEEQKDANVSVHTSWDDEFHPVPYMTFSMEDDVLDKDHPYLEI